LLLNFFVGDNIIDIRFASSRDSLLRLTRDAYVEFATKADGQLALSLHQKLYKDNNIKGWQLDHSLLVLSVLLNLSASYGVRSVSIVSSTHWNTLMSCK